MHVNRIAWQIQWFVWNIFFFASLLLISMITCSGKSLFVRKNINCVLVHLTFRSNKKEEEKTYFMQHRSTRINNWIANELRKLLKIKRTRRRQNTDFAQNILYIYVVRMNRCLLSDGIKDNFRCTLYIDGFIFFFLLVCRGFPFLGWINDGKQ